MEATINLLAKQTEAWDIYDSPDVTELGYGGAAGGGKTRLGCYLAIAIAEQHKGSRGAIGRKELKTLRLTTLTTLFEIFSEIGYKKDKDFVYDVQQGVIRFPNSSELLLLDTAYSPQDPEYTRFGSLELTWAWIDESNETPEKAKAILKTRVGRKNMLNGVKVKSFWLETFNPNKGHVYRDYYKPSKDRTMPNYRRFVQALPGDNPHLPQEYIENLKRADKTTMERLLKGNFEFDSDPTRLIKYEAITDLTTNTITDHSSLIITADIARFGGDKIVIATWKGLELYGLGVYTYQGLDSTGDKIRDEAVQEKVPYSNIIVDEDGVGGGVVDRLSVKGFINNATPLPVWNSLKNDLSPANFQNLRSQCYFRLAEYINDHKIAIKITKFNTNIEGFSREMAIEQLFEELDQIKSKDMSTNNKPAIIPKDEMKEQLGRSPDFSDTLMMRMYFEFKKPETIEEEMQYRRTISIRRNNQTNFAR